MWEIAQRTSIDTGADGVPVRLGQPGLHRFPMLYLAGDGALPPFAEPELIGLTVDFLQRAHDLGLDFSPRDGVHIVQYAVKRRAQDPAHPLSRDAAWRESVLRVLGEEALELETLAEKRRRTQGQQRAPLGLGDFFFDPDDPLHPDRPEADDDDEEDAE